MYAAITLAAKFPTLKFCN